MSVSFSGGAKAEICRVFPQKRCCAVAECFGILLYCNKARNAFAVDICSADCVSRSLRSCHEYVYAFRCNDLLIADVESVSESDGIARLEVRCDLALVNSCLHFVIDEDHYDVSFFCSLSHCIDFETVLLGNRPRLSALAESDDYIAARVSEVERMSMSL